MDRINIGNFGGADNGWNIQITARAFRRADTDGLVGKAYRKAVAVGFGVNSYGGNAQIFAGADDAQRNFPTVRYENFSKRAGCQRGLLRIPPADRFARD